jgi:hypothetical protein
MAAFVLAALGLALLAGAKGGDLARRAAGIALVVLALPCLWNSCVCMLHGGHADALISALGQLSGFAILAVLSIIGLCLWRLRAYRARAKELWEKHNGTPRARSLPLPPPRE